MVLPYVSRDGDINPEIRDTTRFDAARLFRLGHVGRDPRTGGILHRRASLRRCRGGRLRTWYLDAPTRMNPTMRYAQVTPGKTEPRGTGIMDSRQRCALEASSANNHACWYDAQLSVFALFAGREAVARETLAGVASRRVEAQLSADGTQPRELARTRSYHYSVFNMLALTLSATSVATSDWTCGPHPVRGCAGPSTLLVPCTQDTSAWPYPEHPGVAHTPLEPALVRGARGYPGADYAAAIERFAATLTPLGRLRLNAFGDLGGVASARPR